MPATASRTLLRQSQFLFRRTAVRHASTTSEAAAKSKEAASSAASKASEGLSKVTSAAGPAISGAIQGAGGALRKIGGRTGRLVAFVDSIIPPTVYYSRVGAEMAKLVFQGQKMTPPNLATFQAYFQPLIQAAKNPSTVKNLYGNVNPEQFLTRIRSMDRRQLAVAGVTVAEVIGFFAIGEMIGRMKIVGYRGEPAHEH